MIIEPIPPGVPCTKVPRAAALDDRLSLAARGVLVELLSYGDQWPTGIGAMVRAAGSAGGTRPRELWELFAELGGAGYLPGGSEWPMSALTEGGA